MRGKLYRPAQAVSGARITHAGARKTVSVYPSAARASDHPRGCGENPPSGLRLTPSTRITPADAGKTATVPARACAVSDHPRGCGENAFAMRSASSVPGSPPRMRGKLPLLIEGIVKGRITPADAGKTSARLSRQTFRLDHPRGCGENTMSPFLYKAVSGSPPRMRGKLNCRVTSSTRIRITPADAGKTPHL